MNKQKERVKESLMLKPHTLSFVNVPFVKKMMTHIPLKQNMIDTMKPLVFISA